MDQITPSSPLARVRAGFASKKDLIEKLKGLASTDLWLDRLNEDKSFAGLSNQKLLRLYTILSDAKQKYGSREKLIDVLVSAVGRAKDQDYRKHFANWPLPRLIDALTSARRRAAHEQGTAIPAPKGEAAPPPAQPVARAAAKATSTARKPAPKKAASAAGKPPAKAGAKKGTKKK